MAGCFDHAERTHPFDPRSNDFENEGALTGVVSAFYAPYAPLAGVEVRVQAIDSLAQGQAAVSADFLSTTITDAEGAFLLRLPAASYRVSFRKDKYAVFTDTLLIQTGGIEQVNIALNGLPYADELHLTTTHISQWWPPPFEFFILDIAAEVDDLDGVTDVSRVWLEIPALGFADTLVEATAPGIYSKMLDEVDLPAGGLRSLEGKAFTLHVRDQAGTETVTAPQFLVRVIEPTPNPLLPSGLSSLTNPTPRLTWEAAELPYDFTYRVDVVRVQANIQTTEQTMLSIPPDSLSIVVPEPLTVGEYFWTVSVVDEFGNRSRSREAGFRIE